MNIKISNFIRNIPNFIIIHIYFTSYLIEIAGTLVIKKQNFKNILN